MSLLQELPTLFELIEGAPFCASAEENTRPVMVRRQYASGEQLVPMVAKDPKYFAPLLMPGQDRAEHYYQIWLSLQEAGIPVVPEVIRYSATTALMTDITTDGSLIYGKHQSFRDFNRPEYQMEQARAALARVNIREVRDQAAWVVDMANQRGIGLADDDSLALKMAPTGVWTLMALDITKTRLDLTETWSHNRKNGFTIVDDIEQIQRKLV
jgi:hypothetical protein